MIPVLINNPLFRGITPEKLSANLEEISFHINPEKPDVPLNKNDAFQKVQKRRVQEKR